MSDHPCDRESEESFEKVKRIAIAFTWRGNWEQMKYSLGLLLIALACAPALRAAEAPSAASETVTKPKDSGAASAEPSEKEALLAVNAKLAQLEARVAALEADQRSQLKVLRSGVQTAFDQIGEAIGDLQRSIAQLKKAAKPAPVPAVDKTHQP